MTAVALTEMLGIAEGEVASLQTLIELHRAKRSRPSTWFEQHERILQHRKQVVLLVEREIADRRAAERKENAA